MLATCVSRSTYSSGKSWKTLRSTCTRLNERLWELRP